MPDNDIEVKLNKIRTLLNRKGISGIILSTKKNFMWLTGGRNNDVVKNIETTLVYLLVNKNTKYLISWASDKNRIMQEELNDLGFELLTYEWYNQSFLDAIKKLNITGNIGADFSVNGLVNIESELSILRTELTDYEIEKIKILCQEFSKILTDFCFKLKPHLTEKEIAANFNYYCAGHNINLPVLLVGSDERIFKYRHPVATDKKVDKYILFGTVAERDGLNASLTRSVYFGKTPDELVKRQNAVNYMEAFYWHQLKVGANLKDIFNLGKDMYEKLDFKDEYKKHTQGGLVAYTAREIYADEIHDCFLKENNLMGWNPTVPGAKAEDMILIKKDKIEQLSIDKRWTYQNIVIENKEYLKPLILEI